MDRAAPPIEPSSDRTLRFASFRLDLLNLQLRQGDRAIRLMPKTFDLLRYLVENPQRLVTKGELLQAVWPGVVVSEAVLKAHIREIRRSLQDDFSSPRFVETVHRRGYRFLHQLARVPEISQARPPDAPASTAGIMVGRDEEVRTLAGLLDEVRSGSSRVVLLTGEPGIGKTTLINRFLQHQGSAPGLLVATGQCVQQYGEGAAYLPFAEALSELCRGRNSAAALEILQLHAPTWLAHLPESLVAPLASSWAHRAAPATPERLMRQLAEAVAALTQLEPVLLVVEDLQWLDASSLNLLAYLAQKLTRQRLMILGTYRSGGVRLTEHPLWSLQELLKSRNLCREIALRRLGPSDVAEHISNHFARHQFPDELAVKIFEVTSGNPLFMVGVLEELTSRGLIRAGNGRWVFAGDLAEVGSCVPDAVLSLINWELERVSELEREVLQAAAVAGFEFSTAAVARVLATDSAQVESVCSRWLRQGRFVEQVSTARAGKLAAELRCRFSHALYHQVLYDQLGPARRAQLQGLFAGCLQDSCRAQPQRIAASAAMHFASAGDRPNAIWYGYLPATARSSAEDTRNHTARARARAFELRAATELARYLGADGPVPNGY